MTSPGKSCRMEIEEAALAKEKDDYSRNQLNHVQNELKELRDRTSPSMKEKWETEDRNPFSAFRSCARRLSRLNARHRACAARIRSRTRPPSSSTASSRSSRSRSCRGGRSALTEDKHSEQRCCTRTVSTEEEIAKIVCRWTGIPVSRSWSRVNARSCCSCRRSCISASSVRMKRFRRFPKRSCVRARASRIRNRPIGSFLFLGPTGVGKTELAKTLARGPVRRRKAR